MNILLVGEEAAGIQMLRALGQTEHRIVGVMASSSKKGNGGPTMWNVAQTLGYTTWPAQLVKDPEFASQVAREKVDILLNVHSLFIIQGAVVAAPRLGSFNLHPGPLPRYAGLNAVSWAIYRGEKTHGVTVHKMVPEIDSGPIVYQAFFPIEETDTALSLSSKCVKEGLVLMLRLLKQAAENPEGIPFQAQDLAQREYFGREVPEGGRLSWARPAREVVNFVRACDYYPFQSPWGHPRATVGEREIAIVKASLTGKACQAIPGTLGETASPGVNVACLDEWILVQHVIVEGKHARAADVLQPAPQVVELH